MSFRKKLAGLALITALAGCDDSEIKKEFATAGEFVCEMKTVEQNDGVLASGIWITARKGSSYAIIVDREHEGHKNLEYHNFNTEEAVKAAYSCMGAFGIKEKY